MKAWSPAVLTIAALVALSQGCATAPGQTRTGAASASAAPQDIRVDLLAFNDFHGNLRPPAPLRAADNRSLGPAIGGIDMLAAYVQQFHAAHQNTVIVSAGDLIGASPLLSALFHDEGTIEAMNRLGLDFNAVGNHEFDDGRAELLRMQRGGCHPSNVDTCLGAEVGTPAPFTGARFAFLAANVVDSANNGTLFPAYGVKTFAGKKIAFIGMTLKGTPAIVDRAGIATLGFRDEAATVNALVPKLRAQGIEAIVVLLHEGGEVTPPRNITTINGCAGDLTGSPVRAIVRQLDDAVDLVISGHTHQAYICKLPNAAGRPISVTSAHDYGRVFTELTLLLDSRTGDVRSVTAINRPVLRDAIGIAPVPALEHLVAGYERLAKTRANRVIGKIAQDFPALPNNSGESPLGDLIADAQLLATRDSDKGNAQIALMNPGGLRAGLDFASSAANEGDGNVTFGEAFTVQPFANALVTMTLTGAQLHTLLEEQFPGCAAGFPTDHPQGQSSLRLLQLSAGFSYAWSMPVDARDCQRVDPASMRLNGIVISPTNRYRVTVNSFLAAGGDEFYVLPDGTERVTGVLDLDALEAWFAAHSPSAPGAALRIRRLN